MIKEVKYGGYTVTPSDYECQDGDLELASNMIPEDGAMQPMLPPLKEFELATKYKLVCIHKVKPEYQYILYNTTDKKLYRTTKAAAVAGTSGYPTAISTETYPFFNHVDAVGNTLLVFSDTYTSSGTTVAGSIDYYLWKGDDYAHLGDHIPDVQLSFGLVGHPRLYSVSDDEHSTFSITFDGIDDSRLNEPFTEENKTKITNQIMAKVNKFVRAQTIDKGRFCFPFLVRYALRLYDGTLTGHSAPILMNPSTKTAPIVCWNRVSGEQGAWTHADCDILLVAADLDYKLVDADVLSGWGDIVKSVDVFISKPIYPYDQNGKITHMSDSNNFDTKFIGRLYADDEILAKTAPSQEDHVKAPLGGSTDEEKLAFREHYTEWSYQQIYGLYFFVFQNRAFPSKTFHMPEWSDDKVAEDIRNTSSFYKLCSLSIDDVISASSSRQQITIDENYLDALLQREQMTDDYQTHDKLMAGVSYNYNNRLNLADVSRKLYRGFRAETMFAYCDMFVSVTRDGDTMTLTPAPLTRGYYVINVFIKEGNKVYRVAREDVTSMMMTYFSVNNAKRSWGCYVYYPNVNAYKMIITNVSTASYEIDLKPHDFLNGACALLDYELLRSGNASHNPSVDESNIVDMPNKVYTSEVNNPFFFPATGINTVGSGKVIGISTAAKALSQGQFGQFPLYAFSTEGVWALEVSSNGTYSAKQPITRDVCINEKSITQLDNAVLFATDRGIMMLSGSDSTCISDEVNDEVPFSLSHLPQIESLLSGMGYAVAAVSDSFKTYLLDCRMIYDYVHQRIIVYNPDAGYTYTYVYSMKSKKWSTMVANIIDSIPSYPQAYAVTKGAQDEPNNLVDYCEESDVAGALKGIQGVLLTRPLKLDDPDSLKTIDTIIQRGYFDYHNDGTVNKVQQVLYGSRDLFNWYKVYSSQDHYLRGFRGTPYKYFRLAVICKLDKDESLYGCTVQYEPRLTNKPR